MLATGVPGYRLEVIGEMLRLPLEEGPCPGWRETPSESRYRCGSDDYREQTLAVGHVMSGGRYKNRWRCSAITGAAGYPEHVD